MNASSRGLFIASLILSFILPMVAAADRLSLSAPSGVSGSVIRDEADPSDMQSCRSMGQLQISYLTEQAGAPRVGMIVTDPRGRRIGYDPVTSKTWQELPQAEAYVDCEENGDNVRNCQATIQICGPVSGAYKLQVVAAETAKYSLSISGKSAEVSDRRGVHSTVSHTELSSVAIEKKSRDALIMRYYREPGVAIELLRGDSRLARNRKP
jgi:hypothetical protein